MINLEAWYDELEPGTPVRVTKRDTGTTGIGSFHAISMAGGWPDYIIKMETAGWPSFYTTDLDELSPLDAIDQLARLAGRTDS